MAAPIDEQFTGSTVVDWKSWTIDQLKALRELTDTQFDARDRAVKISIKEVRRRLETLNHAHEQATADKAQFLTHNAFAPWKDSTEKRLSSIELLIAKTEGERARVDAVTQRLDTMDAMIKQNSAKIDAAIGQRQALSWVPIAAASVITGIMVAIATAVFRYLSDK